VRIGQPMRPEFAAWTPSAERMRIVLMGVGGAAVLGGVMIGGMALGASAVVIGQLGSHLPSLLTSRTLVKLQAPDGRRLKLTQQDLKQVRLLPADDDVGYRVEVK